MAGPTTHSAYASKVSPTKSVRVAPSPAKVVAAFNTWAFKRQQPSSAEQLNAVAAHALQGSTPLRFVLYWGKGPRAVVRGPERQCLDFLARMGQRVADVYAQGVQFELLLTDTHAELNGHPSDQTHAYFADVTAAAADKGFTTRLLSSVVVEAGVSANSTSFAAPSQETLLGLEECAEKWYRGRGRFIDGAAAYYAMNMNEKRAVELCYPNTVFVTFNSGAMRVLFPDRMPIFYMYSLRKGCATKPWFTDDEPLANPPRMAREYLTPVPAAG